MSESLMYRTFETAEKFTVSTPKEVFCARGGLCVSTAATDKQQTRKAKGGEESCARLGDDC